MVSLLKQLITPMKKTIITTLTLAGTAALSFAGMKEDVTKTLNTHFQGIKEGKAALIEKAWNSEQATITEVSDNKVRKQDVKKTFALWTKSTNPKFTASITSINEIATGIAVAKVNLTWKGNVYHDALTLAKTDKGWKIISKVYQTPKEIAGGNAGGYGAF